MRLDKFLSVMGYSRSQAGKLILHGKVYVNSVLVTKKDTKINEEKDSVVIDNKKLEYKKHVYIMLNKPLGFVCASTDKKEKTVFDLLDENLKQQNLFCVGRLDKNTTGLLFLTNDGDFCHNLTSPKSEKEKVYYFELVDYIKNEDVKKLESGVILKDGLHTKTCQITLKNNKCGYIKITEGKYHQVRRMFASIGNKVEFLNRIEIAGVKLDSNIKLGQYRMLKDDEINILMH